MVFHTIIEVGSPRPIEPEPRVPFCITAAKRDGVVLGGMARKPAPEVVDSEERPRPPIGKHGRIRFLPVINRDTVFHETIGLYRPPPEIEARFPVSYRLALLNHEILDVVIYREFESGHPWVISGRGSTIYRRAADIGDVLVHRPRGDIGLILLVEPLTMHEPIGVRVFDVAVLERDVFNRDWIGETGIAQHEEDPLDRPISRPQEVSKGFVRPPDGHDPMPYPAPGVSRSPEREPFYRLLVRPTDV